MQRYLAGLDRVVAIVKTLTKTTKFGPIHTRNRYKQNANYRGIQSDDWGLVVKNAKQWRIRYNRGHSKLLNLQRQIHGFIRINFAHSPGSAAVGTCVCIRVPGSVGHVVYVSARSQGDHPID